MQTAAGGAALCGCRIFVSTQQILWHWHRPLPPRPAAPFRGTDLSCVLHAPSSPHPYTCGTGAESSGACSCSPAVWKILEAWEQLFPGDGISHWGDLVLQSNSGCAEQRCVPVFQMCETIQIQCETAHIHHACNDLIPLELWVMS